MIGWGSGALIMRAMWTQFPLKVVSALWAGRRNSYSASTQVREVCRVTFQESCKFGLSLAAILPSLSKPANPVLIMLRKSKSSWSREWCSALAIVHNCTVVRGDFWTVARPWRRRAPFKVRLTSAVARLARISGKNGSRLLQILDR